MFKSGSVRIEKCKDSSGNVVIHAKEQQTPAIHKVEQQKPNAHDIDDNSPRERHLEFHMGATYESINVLLEICDRLLPQLTHDLEISAGVKRLRAMTEKVREVMEPEVVKYGENKEFGQGVSTALRDAVFPKAGRGAGAYESLIALQGLYMYLSHLESHLTALTPASQALWDKDFVEAVAFAQTQIGRQQTWVNLQIKTRSPQTLLVPAKPLPEGFLKGQETN